jgi:hypothetical protein
MSPLVMGEIAAQDCALATSDGEVQAATHSQVAAVVYMLPYPPPPGFDRQYFVRDVQAAGIATEYWDVGRLLGYQAPFTADIPGLRCTTIRNLGQLAECLRGRDNARTVYVPQITRTVRSVPIDLLLAHFRAKTLFFGRGFLPNLDKSENTIGYRFRKLWRSRNRGTRLGLALSALVLRVIPRRKHEIVFAAGRMAERVHARDASRIVPIHHFDIDRADAGERGPPGLPPRYCVFLDDFLPFHPDFALFGTATIDAHRYYSALRTYFGVVEQAIGCDVIIAASPKASYDVNPFGARRIVHGATEALVRGSELVLAHQSTAIAFAVIHRKPLQLLVTADIRDVLQAEYNQVRRTAAILGSPIIDCDSPQLPAASELVDESKYHQYRLEYLSTGGETRKSAEVVVDEIARLLGGPVGAAQHG